MLHITAFLWNILSHTYDLFNKTCWTATKHQEQKTDALASMAQLVEHLSSCIERFKVASSISNQGICPGYRFSPGYGMCVCVGCSQWTFFSHMNVFLSLYLSSPIFLKENKQNTKNIIIKGELFEIFMFTWEYRYWGVRAWGRLGR